MAVLVYLLITAVCCTHCIYAKQDNVTEGTELILSFLIFRHGDRTPVQSIESYVSDQEALEELIAPYGYGQLTNVGKRTSYKIARFLRDRYVEILSPVYNKSEIYIRSTDAERTKMTALLAMAGLYPAYEGSWSEDINWVPVPYTTTPPLYDFGLSWFFNCPNFVDVYKAKRVATNVTAMEKYSDVVSKISQILDTDFTSTPQKMYYIYDFYVSVLSLGLELKEEIIELLPELKEAAGAAIDYFIGDDDYIALESGVLMNSFFEAVNESISSNDTKKVLVYSAHDANVYALQAVSRVPRQGVPQYGALYALELRKVVETGVYVVLPVYVPSPGEEPVYLIVEGCDQLCDLDSFAELTADYVRDVATWKDECGWTEDQDTSTFDFDNL